MEKHSPVFLLCCLLLTSQLLTAQITSGLVTTPPKVEKVKLSADKKNIIKINLTSLIFTNASLQYERTVRRNMSVALGVSFMPKTPLPFASTLQEQYGHNADAKKAIENTQLGNFSVTPEVRFYVGKKGAPTGFYLAPFVRYNRMQFDQLYEYHSTDEKLYHPHIIGTIDNIGGGLLIGAQWNLSKSITLDWWIAGPIYGSTSGTFNGKEDMSTMSAAEKQRFEKQIEDTRIPLTKIEATVSSTQVDVKTSGPYLGLRALGFALGFKF